MGQVAVGQVAVGQVAVGPVADVADTSGLRMYVDSPCVRNYRGRYRNTIECSGGYDCEKVDA